MNQQDLTLKSEFPVRTNCPTDKTVIEFLVERFKQLKAEGRHSSMIDITAGKQSDFSTFEADARSIGAWLCHNGMKKDDIGIYMSQKPLCIHLYLAGVWTASGVPRDVYPDEDEEAIEDIIRESRAEWILCDTAELEKLSRIASRLPWKLKLLVSNAGEEEGGEDKFHAHVIVTPFKSVLDNNVGVSTTTWVAPPAAKSSDLALILSTSGTTGRSKGVCFTHAQVLASITKTTCSLPWFDDDDKPNLVFFASSHLAGFLFPLAVMITGRRLVVLTKNDRERTLEAIANYKPGLVIGILAFLKTLVSPPIQNGNVPLNDSGLSSIEACICVGVPLAPAVEEGLYETLPNLKAVLSGSGMTECGCLINGFDQSAPEHRRKYPSQPAGATGKIVPGISLQIRFQETGSRALGPNQPGELCIKGDSVFHSYYKRPDETQQAFTSDTWFKTGDIGYYDENGFIFLTERKNRMFKYTYHHILPRDIEHVIMTHSLVSEAAVVGIPDHRGRGFIPRAFVVLRNGSSRSTDTEEYIYTYANGRLDQFKQLRGGLVILEEMPKNKAGKIDYNALKNWK